MERSVLQRLPRGKVFFSEKEIVNFRDVEIRRYGSDYDLIHRVK